VLRARQGSGSPMGAVGGVAAVRGRARTDQVHLTSGKTEPSADLLVVEAFGKERLHLVRCRHPRRLPPHPRPKTDDEPTIGWLAARLLGKDPCMGRVTRRRRILHAGPDGSHRRDDHLAVEEPLELRIAGKPLTVTMRTPGHDVELAHGFLLTEGIIAGPADVVRARYCDSRDAAGRNTYNVLDLALAPHVPDPGERVRRDFLTTSACGVCGKSSLDAVRTRTRFPPGEDPLVVTRELLTQLPERLREAQRVFESTGGLHAAGLFDADGTLQVAREDVGRHNAVDKVLGATLLTGHVPARNCILMVSGRASFELVQKAVMAGVPVLAAVSAPSSLAAELAAEAGLTLVGFLRGDSMNVYTGMHRLIDRAALPAAAT
jgi:FdhD protein